MTMFSSDYPHSATIWPNSRKVALRMIDGMKAEDARKALSENAILSSAFPSKYFDCSKEAGRLCSAVVRGRQHSCNEFPIQTKR